MGNRFPNLVGACAFTALLAACGGSSGGFAPFASPAQAVGAAQEEVPAERRYQTLYVFHTPDGAEPQDTLTTINHQKGMLYGTTLRGGTAAPGCKYGPSAPGCGTVFEVSTSGQERVLHLFTGGNDGRHPHGSLVSTNGVLYGTTPSGGGQGASQCYEGCGTIFSVSTSSDERVLYRFKGGTDGAAPYAGLTSFGGVFYGTTWGGGGKADRGTIFRVTTSGHERVLYRFQSGTDGAHPIGALTVLDGTLYGTTSAGGAKGFGTVFAVSTSGQERVLYSFGALPDGQQPAATLLALKGVLYGTTESGGDGSKCNAGCGTVFEVTKSGKERVLHRFGGLHGGSNPQAPMIALRGELYGTVTDGGFFRHSSDIGGVFEISPSGSRERVLRYFPLYHSGGSNPVGGLIAVDGQLYGTTSSGGRIGRRNVNNGSFFRISP